MLDDTFTRQNQSSVRTYLLTLATRRSGDSNRSSHTTVAIFARGAITSLATSISLKRESLNKVRKVSLRSNKKPRYVTNLLVG